MANLQAKQQTYGEQESATVYSTVADHGLIIDCQGLWNTYTVNSVDEQMRSFENTQYQYVVIDIQNIDRLDTAGAWLLERLRFNLMQRSIHVEMNGIRDSWSSLFKVVEKSLSSKDADAEIKSTPIYIKFFESIGHFILDSKRDLVVALYILGSTMRGSQMKRGKRSGINLPALVTQIDRMGVGALPIIILMSFIVGAIIAQQGAFQLRMFGAEIYAVDLVGLLVFRELGVLLTAIMIAGRSGSAITAEIGSMKMREETDALTVMGLNPIGVLIFPRLVALAIILPLLTVVADLSALVGACFVADVYSNITFDAFADRLKDAVTTTTYLAGLIKAPFMALIIGIISSVEGLKVGGSAESLGRCVTSSVVQSIFIVIVIDGLFAIFYSAINF